MDLPEIPNFESLLSFVPDKRYIRCETKRLTAAGENYGSVALAIDIIFQNKNSEEETVHAVAKLLPNSEFMKLFMNISFTVRNELGFYDTILPTLRYFQKQKNYSKRLDFFPKFYSGRLGLSPEDKSLENSVILLENLKVTGYELWDKNLGFDLQTTKLILENMAELHGAVLALKEQQPDIFLENIMPFFEEFKIFEMGNNEEFMTSEVLINAVLEIVNEDELCVLYLQRIKEMIQTCVKNLGLPKNTPKFREDVFASLIHNDLWVNNIMIKTHLGKIVDVKFLDWQLYEYASVTKDLLFFLCSSTEDGVLKDNFDGLFKFYHEKLIENLEELGCETDKYSFDIFQEELRRVSREIGYFYVMIALPSIFASGDQVFEVHELSKEKMLGQVETSNICKNRICLITRKFIQKGWL